MKIILFGQAGTSSGKFWPADGSRDKLRQVGGIDQNINLPCSRKLYDCSMRL